MNLSRTLGVAMVDLRTAWRQRLEREGKYNTSGGSIRDIVLGQQS